MSQTEAAIQLGIQAAIQSMAEFADADVVINDWGVLDGSTQNAPYVIITTADTFNSRQDAPTAVNKYDVPVTLVEAFTDWPTTLNNFRDRRQAIIDKINSGNARSAGGLEAVSIDEVRPSGPIVPYYEKGLSQAQREEATPQFLMQELILAAEEI